VSYADSDSPDGQKRRRRRKCVDGEGEMKQISKAIETAEETEDEGGLEGKLEDRKPKRECPVPKPGGVVGELLGFKSSRGERESRPP
jgi:cytochrome c oxidase assembly factor 2